MERLQHFCAAYGVIAHATQTNAAPGKRIPVFIDEPSQGLAVPLWLLRTLLATADFPRAHPQGRDVLRRQERPPAIMGHRNPSDRFIRGARICNVAAEIGRVEMILAAVTVEKKLTCRRG